MSALVISGDTSGAITLQSPAVAGTNTVNFGANTGTAILDANTPAFRNRIINGAMVIDQRNAGAATANTINGYTLDRWSAYQSIAGKYTVQQNAGAVTPPAGFVNYLGVTSSSAYSILTTDQYIIYQTIEGYNIADFAWGTANATPITISFWVRSSLTGLFGGALSNTGTSRNYPFSFTINSANTWEQKAVTIAGDTTGTWLTTNGWGMRVSFNLGTGATYSATAGAWTGTSFISAPTGATSVVGTNGATFYITGVQLEKGSTATSFDYRPYGTELQLCQRYLPTANAADYYTGLSATTAIAFSSIKFPVTVRVAPTGISASSIAGYTTTNGGGAPISVTSISFAAAGVNSSLVRFDVASGLTVGQSTVTVIGTAPLLFTGCEL